MVELADIAVECLLQPVLQPYYQAVAYAPGLAI